MNLWQHSLSFAARSFSLPAEDEDETSVKATVSLSGDLLRNHAALGAEDLGGGGVVGEAGEAGHIFNTPVWVHLTQKSYQSLLSQDFMYLIFIFRGTRRLQ